MKKSLAAQVSPPSSGNEKLIQTRKYESLQSGAWCFSSLVTLIIAFCSSTMKQNIFGAKASRKEFSCS
jgi:hypothetical protein